MQHAAVIRSDPDADVDGMTRLGHQQRVEVAARPIDRNPIPQLSVSGKVGDDLAMIVDAVQDRRQVDAGTISQHSPHEPPAVICVRPIGP